MKHFNELVKANKKRETITKQGVQPELVKVKEKYFHLKLFF